MIATINRVVPEASRLADSTLTTVFNKFWPDLKEQVEAIPSLGDENAVPVRSKDSKLDEILGLLRYQNSQQQRRNQNLIRLIDDDNYAFPIAEMARRNLSVGDAFSTNLGTTIIITPQIIDALIAYREASNSLTHSLARNTSSSAASTSASGTTTASGVAHINLEGRTGE